METPQLTDPFTGDYATKMKTFLDTQLDLAKRYRDADHNALSPYAEEGMLNGVRLTQAVLLKYFEHHAAKRRQANKMLARRVRRKIRTVLNVGLPGRSRVIRGAIFGLCVRSAVILPGMWTTTALR